MNVILRNVRRELFLMITLSKNMTLRLEVDTVSNLIAKINFKNKNFCDARTLNTLNQNFLIRTGMLSLGNIKVFDLEPYGPGKKSKRVKLIRRSLLNFWQSPTKSIKINKLENKD